MNKYDKEAQAHWVKKENWEDWENKRAEEAGQMAIWMLGLGGFCVAVYAFFDWIVG